MYSDKFYVLKEENSYATNKYDTYVSENMSLKNYHKIAISCFFVSTRNAI